MTSSEQDALIALAQAHVPRRDDDVATWLKRLDFTAGTTRAACQNRCASQREGTAPTPGDRESDTRCDTAAPSDEAIRASLEASPPSVTMGCTCRWDEHGNPPDDCDCAAVAKQRAVIRRTAALTAAYAIDLPRVRAEERAATLREVDEVVRYASEDLADAIVRRFNPEAE